MRAFRIVLPAAVLALSLVAAASAQGSVAAGSATVASGVTANSDLRLLGVSTAGYAVARDGDRVVATGTGGTLTDYDTAYDTATAVLSDLTGPILRWAEKKGAAWVIHRENVFGGGRVDYDSADQPLALTTDSWLGYANGTLRRHVFGGPTTTLLTGLTSARARADDQGAVVLYGLTVSGQARTRVGLITFGRPGVEVLADHADATLSGENPTNIALTPASVVWYAEKLPVTVLGAVHRRARTGGAVSSADSPAQRAGQELVATDTEIATTSLEGRGPGLTTRLWVRTGTAWREIRLPGLRFGGLRSSASTIAFAVGGDDATTAGVYRTGPGSTPVVVARPRPRAGVVTDVSLQAGRLTYGVSTGDGLTTALRRAPVSTSGRLAVGAPAGFAAGVTLAHVRTAARTSALSVFGDRTAVRTDASGVRGELLTDAGAVTGRTAVLPATERPVKRSGAYLLLDDKVYEGDGLTPVLDLSARTCRDTDLFGSLVVCSRPDGQNVVVDAAGRFPTGPTAGSGTGPVAVWGTAVAWASGATEISVQDLNVPGSLRRVPLTTRVHDLELSEGAISFRDDDGYLVMLDRSDPASGPVLLAMADPLSVDDHLVAGIAGDSLQVRTLPFGLTTRYRPRLVDALTPVSFDAGSAAWKPRFDVTKPLTGVKLTLRQGTTVVATLSGTGVTGTVRDLAWNGRTAAGGAAPAGAYTWTLTADARDGDGAVTNIDGSSAVTGTVYLTR